MTISSKTASNAFNFLSFVNNSVDPRTGLYTLAIELPELVANNLAGPSLPLRIGFNPMNIEDSGFGRGWTLNLSQYTPDNNMLHLHTGESFRVDGSTDDGTGRLIKERKLRSFLFHDHGDGYRVEHKSGMIELLEVNGPSDNRVALPTRVEAPSGHGITLRYDNYLGAPCLIGIKDDSGLDLLLITYGSDRVTLDLHPYSGPGGKPRATYTLELDNRFTPAVRVLESIVLPSNDSWGLDYDKVRDMVCLTAVDTPVNGTELIEYADEGHRFPGDAHPALPRVTRHTIKPGHDQADMVTTYTYTSENFLGWGSGASWEDEGEDNLYKSTDRAFRYGSTATYLLGSTPLRSITRRFDRFHLLKLQRTEQTHEVYDRGAELPRRETCIQEAETVYHETDAMFEFQPAFFQMPKYQIKRWKIEGDLARLREEVLITDYDEHGNLTLESVAAPPVYKDNEINQQATLDTTVYTRHTYYPQTGEGEDCPPDPLLFTRCRKTSTVHPAKIGEGQAATLRTRYRYQAVPALSTAAAAQGFLDAREEELSQVLDGDIERVLQATTRSLYKESEHNAFLHGRLAQQAVTLKHATDPGKDKTATSTFFHSLIDDDNRQKTLLQVRETFKAHDLRERTVARAHSIHSGLLMRDQDANKVNIHYQYDVLDRMTAETVMGDDGANAASRTFAYVLGAKPYEEVTDVNGVVSRTWFDGYNRPIQHDRETEDKSTGQRNWHVVQTTQYDSAGRTASETTYDYLDNDEKRTLTSTYGYDGWGERVTSQQPDGVVVCIQRSPFGKEGFIVDTWQERHGEARPRKWRQFASSEYNRFDKPISDRRLDTAGQLVGRMQYYYDGIGRCVRQVQHLRDPLDLEAPPLQQETKLAYDVWGRMNSSERPDGSKLLRRFASHSTDELTIELSLEPAEGEPGSIICERTFDGLDRLTRLTVGKRTERFNYHGQTTLVDEHTKASGRILKYAYTPELTQQPTSVALKGATAANDDALFDYARPDAEMTSAENNAGTRSYDYTDQGYLLEETWTDKTTNTLDYSITHDTSLQGRPLKRTASNGPQTVYTYDAQGRLQQTRQARQEQPTRGYLEATFIYDADGRLYQTTTLDNVSKRQVTSTVLYDDQGRESERSVALDDGSTRTIQLVWQDNDLLHSRATLQDGQQRLLETFRYDGLNRLTKVSCTLEDEGDAEAYLPRNRAGRSITAQVFRFDLWDNLTRCQTTFHDGNTDDGRFEYGTENADDVYDRFQLRELSHSLHLQDPGAEDYPKFQAFTYDKDGNQCNDEWGNALTYDDFGRLQQVTSSDGQRVLSRYRYDAHNDLVGVTQPDGVEQLRRYEDYRLSAVTQGNEQVHYLYGDTHPLGLQNLAKPQDTRLLVTDHAASVTAEYSAGGVSQAHLSVYGERGDDDSLKALLSFNGEVREQLLDWYLLGRGLRAYNPGLMRFHSPDSLPQEDAGVNPYMYALGNPVNWVDPTGHRSSPVPSRDPKPPYIDPLEEPKGGGFMDILGHFGALAAGIMVGAILASLLPPVGAMVIGVTLIAVGAGMYFLADKMTSNSQTQSIIKYAGAFIAGVGLGMLGKGAFRYFKGAGGKVTTPGSRAGAGSQRGSIISNAPSTGPAQQMPAPAPQPAASPLNTASAAPAPAPRAPTPPVDYSTPSPAPSSAPSSAPSAAPSPAPTQASSLASSPRTSISSQGGVDTTSYINQRNWRHLLYRTNGKTWEALRDRPFTSYN
ncbi:RHS repeat-associated core domain-containing protein [Pseudomonas sp. TWI628]|uniref:RHS repeat-associated core domain-containing protein n=1 Tax=Pseudomonas sp. TWI628 TaxID=3136788 RepID=UPI0032082C53